MNCVVQPNLRSQLGQRGSASLVGPEHHGHGRSPSAARSRTETGEDAESQELAIAVLLMTYHDRSATVSIGGFRELGVTSVSKLHASPDWTQAIAELRSVMR